MDSLDRLIDIWKSRLIDLSKRNRLLFFKPGRTSTIEVTNPSLDGLFEALIVKERSLSFPKVAGSAADQMELDADGEHHAPVPVTRGDMDVGIEVAELTRRLYRLRRDTNTSTAELGHRQPEGGSQPDSGQDHDGDGRNCPDKGTDAASETSSSDA